MKFCPKCDHPNPADLDTCEECGADISETASEGKDPQIGKLLGGKFRIKELIGQGAMGRVYKAEQEPINRDVAVKILHRHLMDDRRVAKRFQREAEAASRFNHPNSIGIFDFGQTENGSLYIAMEYITGRDLAEIITREAPLEPERSVRIVTQVLSALHLAHANNIIHRDLKPENIMLADLPGHKDFVKVCDFGIAKIQKPAGSGKESALTMFGMICGTPYYMSPEQAKGEELDGRTDIYSMGVILYEMLTAEVPFRGATPVEVIARHLTDPPVPPSQTRPGLQVSRALEDVILKALSKKRDNRFATAQEFSESMEQALKEAEFQADLERVLREVEELDQSAATPAPVTAGVSSGGGLSPAAATPLPQTRERRLTPSALQSRPPASPGNSPVARPVSERLFATEEEDLHSPKRGPGVTPAALPIVTSVESPQEGGSQRLRPSLPARQLPLPAGGLRTEAPLETSLESELDEDDEEIRPVGTGRWVFLIVLFVAIAVGGYFAYKHSQKEPVARRTPPKKLSRRLPPRQLRRPLVPPPRRTQRVEKKGKAFVRARVKARRLKPHRRRTGRRARLALRRRNPSRRRKTGSARQRRVYRSLKRSFRLWKRRLRLQRSDVGKSYDSYLRATRLARRRRYREAAQILQKLQKRLNNFTVLPRPIAERKFERLQAAHRQAKAKKKVAPTLLQKVENQYFPKIYQSFIQGKLKEMNRQMNKAFRMLRR